MLDDNTDMIFNIFLSRVKAEKRALAEAFNGSYTEVRNIRFWSSGKWPKE
jgi:hypothetical protein